MGDAQEENKGKGSNPPAAVDVDAFLDLNFVPQWARRPPDAVHARRFSDRGEDTRGGRGRDAQRDGAGRERRREYTQPRGDTSKPRRPAGRSERTGDAGEPRHEMAEIRPAAVERGVRGDRADNRPDERAAGRGEFLPAWLQAQFLPERAAILELGKRIGGTHKAYPLLDLAGVLLGREGLCYVRLDVTQPGEGRGLHQCQLCRTVALTRAAIVQHIVEDHLADFFTIETETVEPPAGVFVCVAICGLSGRFLGPPNHHSYSEAVKAVHAEHFSDMDLERYRGKIRISHAAEDVEKWKASCTTRTVYRRKAAAADAEPGEPLSQKDAQRFMEAEVAGTRVKVLRRVVLREREAHAVRDPVIHAVLRRAWEREVRFPIQVALALRAALRSRHLHIFKAGSGKGMHFVTAVKPVALDPDTAIPAIRDALRYLEGHPGCTREEMRHDLIGDVPADDPRVKELFQPISWLTERGHILEFFNGRLAVPRHLA